MAHCEPHRLMAIVPASEWVRLSPTVRRTIDSFFHGVYRIQQRLGRIFRELQPYGLFPLDEYFAGALKGTVASFARPEERPPGLVPPLKKAA